MSFFSRRRKIKVKKLSQSKKVTSEHSFKENVQPEQKFNDLQFKTHDSKPSDAPNLSLGKLFPELRVGSVVQLYFEDCAQPPSEVQSKSSFFQKTVTDCSPHPAHK